MHKTTVMTTTWHEAGRDTSIDAPGMGIRKWMYIYLNVLCGGCGISNQREKWDKLWIC